MDEQQVSRREYEADQNSIWRELGRLGAIVEGPPHPGLETRVNAFLTEFRTLESERDKQHKANRNRLNTIIAILVAIAGYLALFKH